MNFTTGSEYTENIYIHLKLVFAFAAQSSLSEVRNGYAVRTRGTCAVPTRMRRVAACIRTAVPHTQTSSRNPLFRYLVARLAPIMISLYSYYVQLHMDDAILCIINDVMGYSLSLST